MEMDSLFTVAEFSMDIPEMSLGSTLASETCSKDTAPDDNNNQAPTPSVSDDPTAQDDNLDISTIKARYKVEYNLRKSSLANREETEKRRKSPKAPKPKSRPPPLSKYRRRAANARERGRMLEINDAFDALADAIPVYQFEDSKGKPTKITTLRLALNYITALRETLGYPSATSESDFSSTGEGCNSPSGGSSSDFSSEGLRSPATSNLDSEGETVVQ
ncbi:neurogenic differentiation factor 1-like [Liolophura sinensis]|uniref:neurogenic differentiation factor 1-like n=1 Tax=Liolophura sinensis TaxID=3198878 RepID=UPI003159755F